MSDHMMIYACAIMSLRGQGNEKKAHLSPMLCWAANDDEATGKAIRIGGEIYPSADQYQPCIVAVTPLPYDMAQAVARRVGACQYGVDIGGEGPTATTEAEAMRLWNMRREAADD